MHAKRSDDMPENRYECAECGKGLSSEQKSCPICGSNKRRVYVTVSNGIKLRDCVKGKVKDVSGKTKRKFLARQKVSKHGKEAREQLDIDIKGNRKYHHVEELDKSGNWIVVHHEDEPLKRRRKK
jgi:predicted  nucleic acid-binding Zn-ribbon protein